MNPSVQNSIVGGLGPLTKAVPPGDSTALTATGIYNNAALGTTATKVVSGGNNQGKIRRCKIVCITAGRNISWATVLAGAASPANKADADGSADEGSLIMGGGGAMEWVSIVDNMDLYLVASAASTVVQVTMVESP